MDVLSLRRLETNNENEEVIDTNFNFLKAHNGLRRGHIHVLLGRTNKGKSALVLDIIVENAIQELKCMLFISEGHKETIGYQIEQNLKIKKVPVELHERVLKNISIINERDFKGNYKESPDHWVNALTRLARDFNSDLLFIDNISGIKYGNTEPEEQVRFLKYFNESVERDNMVGFLVVHQSKSSDFLKELECHDVRANQNFTSLPSFVYALNDFANLDKNKRIIRILKSRLVGEAIDKYFELFYKSVKSDGFYQKDREISKKSAKNAFSTNYKLSKTSLNH